jgi:hypothetical protein
MREILATIRTGPKKWVQTVEWWADCRWSGKIGSPRWAHPPTQTDKRCPRGISCLRPDPNGSFRTASDTKMGRPGGDALNVEARHPGRPHDGAVLMM